MVSFVQSLRSEIDDLEESIRTSPDPRALKLQELKKVLALYVGKANSPTVVVDSESLTVTVHSILRLSCSIISRLRSALERA